MKKSKLVINESKIIRNKGYLFVCIVVSYTAAEYQV